MAWRIVRQPNGRYARFSDIVDSFTHHNMTAEQAVALCREFMSREDAQAKVARADEPTRWDDCLKAIRLVHGRTRLAALLREMKEKVPGELEGEERS